jgi:sugar lactone lactonase YvrE
MKKCLLLFIVPIVIVSCRNAAPRVTTYAGSGTAGSANGNANDASFLNPMGVAVDSNGNVFVADSRNNLVRKISANGMVSTIAGSGKEGSTDGKASTASFFFPIAVATGPDGSVYIADTHNSLIRKISPAGIVSTIAGQLTAATKEHPDSLQRLDNPSGITVGKDGVVYFTDWERNLVRKISPDGKMSIIAGSIDPGSKDGRGKSASFNLPEGIAVDDKGNLYIADTYNNMIRKITPDGLVTTLAGKPALRGKHNAGSKDGKGPAASFSKPCGIAVDRQGNVYVADVGNNKIRRVTQDGTVTTFAGTGLRGAQNGPARTATFYRPFGVAVDKAGNVYVADYQNNLVRKIGF